MLPFAPFPSALVFPAFESNRSTSRAACGWAMILAAPKRRRPGP